MILGFNDPSTWFWTCANIPTGDCALANVHQSRVPPLLATVDGAGWLSKIDSNHASEASDVVQTSTLGPAARYNGIFAVSTDERKRKGAAGMAGEGAPLHDENPTSGAYQYVHPTTTCSFTFD